MMNRYRLPTSVVIDGETFEINEKGDYRMVLDVIALMDDMEVDNDDKVFGALSIFYNFNIPFDQRKAYGELNLFIDCGEKNDGTQQVKPPVMNWGKDFPIICDDINAKYGIDIRGMEYLHWWTFISYYKNLGEGQFNTITNIRTKKQKGQKLEKWEQEFYAENRAKVDLDVKLESNEQEFLNELLGVDN